MVRIENPDYAPARRQVKVQIGAKLKPLHVDLTAGEGGLYIVGPRQGLKIYLDDRFTGSYTPERVVARAGAHVVPVRTIVATRRVIIDPWSPGILRVEFEH